MESEAQGQVREAVWVPVESMSSQIWEPLGQPGACRLCPTAVPQ